MLKKIIYSAKIEQESALQKYQFRFRVYIGKSAVIILSSEKKFLNVLRITTNTTI